MNSWWNSWKTWSVVGGLFVIVFSGPSLARTITLDGDMSDWIDENIFYTDDEIGDGMPLNSTYSNVYVCNNSSNLFLAFQRKAPADISSNWTYNVFLDTDMDAATGFRGTALWMTGGYDRLLQYGGGSVYSAYEHQGADQTVWDWNFIGYIGYGDNGQVVEWSVPRTWLGMGAMDSQVRLECQVTGGDVTNSGIETWAHSLENNVKTYTFRAPAAAIQVDGNLADWDNEDLFYVDSEISDGLPVQSAYSSIYVMDNAMNLYIGLQCKDSGGGSITNDLVRDVYIDTDVNSATGYRGSGSWMTGGYDVLIQYGSKGTVYSIYTFNGASQGDWSWVFNQYVTYSYLENSIEMAIPRSLLGASSGARIAFLVKSGVVTVDTWAPASEANVKTYTYDAVGNIPTLSEWGMILLALVLVAWGAKSMKWQPSPIT